MLKRILKAIGAIGGVLTLAAVACLLLLSLSPLLASRNPTRPTFLGKYAPMIVLGGSMQPTYQIGSILFIERVVPSDVRVGDVITFDSPRTNPSDPPSLTTHRVTAIENASKQLSFRTQGDANNAEDTALVPAVALVGRGSFAIPYLGYVSAFVRSRVGFVSLVLIPAALIVLMEITSMFKLLRERARERSTRGDTPSADASPEEAM
ncbi:MAG TPA: signal peptidase I [Coriobacteriia bacterium]